MTATEPFITIASDYAVLEVGEILFYYGYEFDVDGDEQVWGVEVKKQGKSVFRAPYQDSWPVDQFESGECLLYGIGLYLADRVAR